MNKIIVFGASGQLGQCLKKVVSLKGSDSFIFLKKEEADILNVDTLSKVFENYKPGWAINCAAYTAVDKAEDDTDMALKINKTGAANIAEQCKLHNTIMIQVSTDFVFKGDKPYPLTEDDITEPIGIYGSTKLEGEKAVVTINPLHYIIRTSWLYSEFANNFVKTMLKLGANRSELNVVADQVGSPTYAIDLAQAILDIINSDSQKYGTYHYSNEGVTSWYDFAKGIFDISGINILVSPIRSSQYPTRAARPAYSVMDKAKIKNNFNIKIPYWRDSLITCINALNSIQ